MAEPKRRSALEGRLRPGRYGAGGEGVVLTERRLSASVQIEGAPAGGEALAAALGVLNLDQAPEPRRSLAREGRALVSTAPGQWLVLSDADAPAALVARLAEALGASGATCLDLSHARTVVRASGPELRALLAKGCALDLEAFAAGDAAATRLGPFTVLLRFTEDDACEIHVFRSFGLALWEWLCERALELGLRVDAPAS